MCKQIQTVKQFKLVHPYYENDVPVHFAKDFFEKRSESDQGLAKEEKPGFSSFFLSGIGKQR